MRCLLPAVLLLCAAPLQAAQPAPAVRHPFLAAQPANVPDEAVLAVEIPAGSFIKYEIGKDGLPFVDRFLSTPMAYPANYGSMPRTRAGDGDPLDALVFTRAPLHPGVLVRFRPVGVLRMTDRGERDEKIVGVPADAVDPTYAAIRELTDLPQVERDRIEVFFRTYKALPQGSDSVRMHGFGDAAEARRLVTDAMRRFTHANGGDSDPARGR